ncbi:concanavalin A-like lectin/glucanase domain-containing protein [Tribonema minus]|uniref:Concanavalin A-like lectin/glucanase domain-containing protein n=1 Tax=Tribonema minus TaxID=303371 RepID=A0A836CKG3_9STRA|nr:concanavalin A-like lectin/glucanase domain-containing protein [Tribonema minus]
MHPESNHPQAHTNSYRSTISQAFGKPQCNTYGSAHYGIAYSSAYYSGANGSSHGCANAHCNVLQLVWSDEFSTPPGQTAAIDASKWVIMRGDGSEWWNPRWGNNELQVYVDDAVYLENNNLVLEARNEPIQACYQRSYETTQTCTGTYNYQSGKVYSNSTALYNFMYDRVEVNVSVPMYNGGWPAAWMLADS